MSTFLQISVGSAVATLDLSPYFSPRLHLGLGNPNSAGALLAMALVSLLPFCLGSWWRRGVGMLISATLGLGIAMTASRGAVVALLVGLVILGWRGTRLRVDRVFLAAVGAGLVLMFCLSPAGKRIHSPQEDRSAQSRWEVLSQVPAMIAAAPEGWGAGRSGEVYMNWFQAPGDRTIYKHVLSTHAIWLVERSWPVRVLYVAMWIVALVWCASAGPRGMAGGVACWSVFFVAGCFSHVGERGWLWILPAAWLVAATGARVWRREFPKTGAWLAMGMGTAGVVLGLALLGAGTKVRLRDGVVKLTAGSPPVQRIGVVAQKLVVGEGFGREIRAHLPDRTEVWYAWKPDARLGVDVLLCAGSWDGAQSAPGVKARELVWVNPRNVLPWELPAEFQAPRVVVLKGQFASFTVAPWRKYFADRGSGEVKVISGVGDFVGDSWQRLLAETRE